MEEYLYSPYSRTREYMNTTDPLIREMYSEDAPTYYGGTIPGVEVGGKFDLYRDSSNRSDAINRYLGTLSNDELLRIQDEAFRRGDKNGKTVGSLAFHARRDRDAFQRAMNGTANAIAGAAALGPVAGHIGSAGRTVGNLLNKAFLGQSAYDTVDNLVSGNYSDAVMSAAELVPGVKQMKYLNKLGKGMRTFANSKWMPYAVAGGLGLAATTADAIASPNHPRSEYDKYYAGDSKNTNESNLFAAATNGLSGALINGGVNVGGMLLDAYLHKKGIDAFNKTGNMLDYDKWMKWARGTRALTDGWDSVYSVNNMYDTANGWDRDNWKLDNVATIGMNLANIISKGVGWNKYKKHISSSGNSTRERVDYKWNEDDKKWDFKDEIYFNKSNDNSKYPYFTSPKFPIPVTSLMSPINTLGSYLMSSQVKDYTDVNTKDGTYNAPEDPNDEDKKREEFEKRFNEVMK